MPGEDRQACLTGSKLGQVNGPNEIREAGPGVGPTHAGGKGILRAIVQSLGKFLNRGSPANDVPICRIFAGVPI